MFPVIVFSRMTGAPKIAQIPPPSPQSGWKPAWL
jgi:hypothetical protein